MMKTSKILININSLEEIEAYKEIGIANFLFAVKDYSIGYKTFSIEEIPKDTYLLINRVLDIEGIESLKKIKDEIAKYRGVIFEDVGVYNIFKDLNIELIWFQNHFSINATSINVWLDLCTSAVISNDITREEIKEILAGTKKSLIFNIFGKNQIMYSRRTLLTNFNKYFSLDNYNDMTLDVQNNDSVFFARESEYGTVIFNNEYFNYIEFAKSLDEDKIKYYLVLNLDLSVTEIKEILDGKEIGNQGFLSKKTVYKMNEYDDGKV